MARRVGACEAAGGRLVGRHSCRAYDSGHRWRRAALIRIPSRAALRWRALILVGLALAPAPRAHAQQPAPAVPRDDARFSFFDRGPYRAGIPTPESLLGYPIG